MFKKVWFGTCALLASVFLLSGFTSDNAIGGITAALLVLAFFYVPYKLYHIGKNRQEKNSPRIEVQTVGIIRYKEEYKPTILELELLDIHNQALETASSMQSFLHKMNDLASFEEVNVWDIQAELRVSDADRLIYKFKQKLSESEARIKEAVGEELNNLQLLNAKINNTLERLYKTKESFQLAIDFTPNDLAEAKDLIKELKLVKKELSLEKKEIALDMKSLNVEARQIGSKIGDHYFTSNVTRQMDRAKRIRLRMEKESMLAPHENRKMLIERQILQIDKNILWIEKLK